MKTVTKLVTLPIFAGMQYSFGKIINAKMRKVGTETFEHTYLVHADGDLQLVNSKRISRNLNY